MGLRLFSPKFESIVSSFLFLKLHVKMQMIAVAMKLAEAVAALGIAVQSKVNVDFMKETVIVMMNVRVL